MIQMTLPDDLDDDALRELMSLLTMWLGAAAIQSGERRITMPELVERHRIVKSGRPVTWGVYKPKVRIAFSRRDDIIDDGDDYKRINSGSVSPDRTASIPVHFFKETDPDDHQTYSYDRVPKSYMLKHGLMCHFYTTGALVEDYVGLILADPDGREVLEAKELYDISDIPDFLKDTDDSGETDTTQDSWTDGGYDTGLVFNVERELDAAERRNPEAYVGEDEVLIVETGEVVKAEAVLEVIERLRDSDQDPDQDM